MKVIVVLPGYNCERTLRKTYMFIPMQYVDDVIYADDGSFDNSVKVAKSLHINHIICNSRNIGYGGNQKTLYDKALELEADVIVMLHPDYQYDPLLIPKMLYKLKIGADVVFASRMKNGKEAIRLGMPKYKFYANRLLTKIQNRIFNQNLSEYHTGYRAYKANVLRDIKYQSLSNDFIFDNQMVLELIRKKYHITEVYCPAKYDKESSSINFYRSIKYGVLVLWYSLVYKIMAILS